MQSKEKKEKNANNSNVLIGINAPHAVETIKEFLDRNNASEIKDELNVLFHLALSNEEMDLILTCKQRANLYGLLIHLGKLIDAISVINPMLT